ncbi:tRNA modification GTPase TrmE [Citrobacter koseri]|uniref:tRNA modification GTPase TrmE n=1 Tax=Citrobacter koseri TaxID=545 RepID=A0A2X2YQS2_CITKO|nr:tRNA modification GTPase TrmE [Citrobacter koseri]
MSHNDTIIGPGLPHRDAVASVSCVFPVSRRARWPKPYWGKLPKPRYADYLRFKDADGTALDQGGSRCGFPARTRSLGEDVLELQGHGARSFSTCC